MWGKFESKEHRESNPAIGCFPAWWVKYRDITENIFCESVMMNEAQSSPKSGIDSDKSLLKKKRKQDL